MNLSIQLQKNKEYDDTYLSKSLYDNYETNYTIENDPLLKNDEKELINSVKDLQEIQNNLASLVNNQKEKLDNIQNNIIETEQQSLKALNDLKVADDLFFSYKPILLGGALGALTLGPAGLLIGAKWTSLSSGLGGLLGSYAGYKVQKN